MNKKIQILGLSLEIESERVSAFEKAKSFLGSNQPRFALALNPEKWMRARKSAELRDIFQKSDLNYVDGVGIQMAVKVLRGIHLDRYPGVDLFFDLLGELNRISARLFLFGASSAVLEKTTEAIRLKYPKIEMVGAVSGYDYSSDELIHQINQSKPHLVAVALGSPKQEEWICQEGLPHCGTFFLGVGGSFDVLSGQVKRAPMWVQKIGLEWLFRLLVNPSRILRQGSLFRFGYRVLMERISMLFSSANSGQ